MIFSTATVAGLCPRSSGRLHSALRRLCLASWSLPLALLLLTLCTRAQAAKPSEPAISIPLERLGFQAVPPRYLASGGSMMTLHFVDQEHLLFTFNARTLLKRLPDAWPGDDDRNVQAVLLELPSGRVLGRTEWRTRDRDQYLWPLTHGRFLLRIRTRLTVLDPLANLAGGDPFRQQPFLDLKRRLGYIAVSPGGELLTVETIPEPKPRLTGAAASAAALAAIDAETHDAEGKGKASPQAQRRAEVQIHFYRLGLTARAEDGSVNRPDGSVNKPDGSVKNPDGRVNGPKAPEQRQLFAAAAGLVRSHFLIHIPVTAEGVLDIAKESAGVYLFDFQSHAGKRIELSPYDTSCAPRPYFVSRSDFVAFGCRGNADKQQISGFNLRGEEPWVQVFSGAYIAPAFAIAPDAGRFALSRVLVLGSATDPANLVAEEMTGQEVAVIQSYDGRVLLKVQATPIQRSGQNLDLSADGLSLAILRAGNIDVFRLPALSSKDQQALKVAEASVPPHNDEVVKLSSPAAAKEEEVSAEPEGVPSVPESKPDLARAVPAPQTPSVTSKPGSDPGSHVAAKPASPSQQDKGSDAGGDGQSETPRKPPSLYDAEHPNPEAPK